MKKCILAFSLFITGCSLAPPYHPPEVIVTPKYQEAGKWLESNPHLAAMPRGPWWEVYDDPLLNCLENKVALGNENLKAAYARYLEARAQTAEARAGFYPTLTAIANPQRLQTSGNIANKSTTPLYNDTVLGSDFSYELDVWGRIRNLVAAAKDRENASAADLAAMTLSLQADMATDYFTLRGYDEVQRILDETVIVYRKGLYLTQQRHNGGASPEADVDQAEAQLKTAETQATDIRLKRAQLVHAIAILTGESPSDFTLPVSHRKIKVITIAPSIPARLLERRPDIAAAEERVASANATIGVARAAFFPDISLLATLGFESQVLANLLRMPSLYWSIGPSATQILFDGGRIQAFLDEATATYHESVANYRQTVLTAFGEVEDNLVAIHRLNQEMVTQHQAVIAANRALLQANYRYKGGIITYLDVIVTQNTALQAEVADVNIRTLRQIASVQLIKAIGGSWC